MKRKEILIALKIYVFTWIIMLLIFFGISVFRGTPLARAFEFFKEIIIIRSVLVGIHTIFLVIYLLFLLFRFFRRTHLKKGIQVALKYAFLSFLAPLIFLFGSFKYIEHVNTNEGYTYQWNTAIENTTNKVLNIYEKDGKHRGMSVFGWTDDNKPALKELLRNNVEWIAITPFLYQKNERTETMRIPDKIGVWSRRDSMFINSIQQMHELGIHVNLKPHLWMNDGWRSNINFDSKETWASWFELYRKNMIHYAKMAALTNVEMLCVGTELKTSLKNQPEAWLSLLREIKTMYNGKLTYAANWDGSFDQTDFWKEFDYIGIQAYFPITKTSNPDLETLKKGWDRHIIKLEKIAKQHKKPILFTEVGYKSEASSTIRPWEWDEFASSLFNKKSDKTQQLAYEAMFQRLWNKDWFQGAYIWQWDTRTTKENSIKNLDFSPRFKPAENTIAKWYGKKAD